MTLTFTASEASKLKLVLEEAWQDARVVQEYQVEPNTALIEALLGQDTSQMETILNQKGDCKGVDVTWLISDPTAAATLVTNDSNLRFPPCDIDGLAGGSVLATYQPSAAINDGFKIVDDDCDNIFSTRSKLSFLSMQCQKRIIDKLTAFLLSRMQSYKGKNLYTQTDKVNIVQYDSGSPLVNKVASQNFNFLDFVGFDPAFRRINRYQSGVWLDGMQMYKQFVAADVASGTMADSGQAKALKRLNYRSCLEEFLVNSINNKMYFVRTGTMAFWTHNYYSVNPTEHSFFNVGKEIRYQMPLGNLTFKGSPLMVDVTYRVTKDEIGSTNKCRETHVWDYRLVFDTFLNPYDTTVGVTGINEIVEDSSLQPICNVAPVYC